MIKNELGNRYGKLVVLARAESKHEKARWLCRCDCGNTKVVSGNDLRQKRSVSCGCYQKEFRTKGAALIHGMSRSPTYRSWQEMKARCCNSDAISYPNYGGRGIAVCEQWMSFEVFLKDMGVRPKHCYLERVNNAAGYSKDNCRWATRLEQNRNKRNLHMITYLEKTQCLSAWCEELHLSYSAMYHRVVVRKIPPNLAFEVSIRKSHKGGA